MTAAAQQEAAAAAAVRQGEAITAQWAAASQQQAAATEGSDVEVSQTGMGPGDGAVTWPSPGSTSGAPAAVSPQPAPGAKNLTDPRDNSQSQGG